jgi:hypothetical protein
MNPYRECLQPEAENQALRNQVKSLQFEILLNDLRASRCPASDRPVQGNWGSIVHCPVCKNQELMLVGASTYRSLNLMTTSSSCHSNRQQAGATKPGRHSHEAAAIGRHLGLSAVSAGSLGAS